jgi:putative protease
LPYALIDTSTGKRVDVPGDYLLSCADLATVDMVGQLAACGVDSLKIEGRMKSPEYVAITTRAYRQALDGLEVDGQPLDEVYSRGFTHAYLGGERGNAMMAYGRPNNRGVAVGRVARITDGRVGVELSRAVVAGDTLEFWTTHGRVACTVDELRLSAGGGAGGGCERVEAGQTAGVKVDAAVGTGDRVFRVRSAQIAAEAALSYEDSCMQGNNGPVAVDCRVTARLGEPLQIVFTAAGHPGCEGIASGDVLEAARSKALTADDLREHVGRVGGTPYRISSFDVTLDEGVGLGFSAIHRLRSQALAALEASILAPWHERALASAPAAVASVPAAGRGKAQLAVLVADAAAAKAAAGAGADLIYAHSMGFCAAGPTNAPALGRRYKGLEPVAVLPAVSHDRDLGVLFERAREAGMVLVNNLGELRLAREAGLAFEAGPSLLAFNGQALQTLAGLGAGRVWLSPELSLEDLRLLVPEAAVPCGLVVYGQQELMVAEHCVLMAQGPCNQDCGNCVRRKAPRELQDRKGYRLPVRTDDFGRSHIYNAVTLDLVPNLPELMTCGLNAFMVDATLLNARQVAAEVARARRGLDLAINGTGSLPKQAQTTTGHLFRGVL